MATKNYYDAPDNNKNLYNAMEAIKRITGYKDQWHTADAKGDTATKDSAAKKAQTYYKMLIDSGYSDVADALKNTNNVGAKYIYDTFMKNNSAPTSTTPSTTTAPTTTTPTETTPTTTPTNTSNGINIVESTMPDATDLSTADGMINDTYNIQRGDKATLSGKYDTLEKYIYSNPFEDDESKAIMENYKFKGKTASDNAVASGGASNGGNIDSYASANANRQQLAFTNAGNQAVLDNFNSRISNLRGMLTEMGVNLQNHYKSMQDTIGLKQGEEQRQFENEETKKNNQVDRDVKISEVTGYVPESMSYANNPYLNDDGTVIDPENTDFSLIKYNAEEALKVETDPQRIADLKQTIRWAEQARVKKTELEKWAKWRNTTTAVAPDETFTSKVTNKELDNNKAIEEKKLETTEKLTQAELEAQERMNSSDNATTLAKADKDNATSLAITDKELGAKLAEAEADVTWEDVLKDYNLSDNAKTLLGLEVYDAWVQGVNGQGVDVGDLLKTHKDSYKLTKQDASEILRMFYDSIPQDDYNEIKKWISEQTWYSKDDTTYTPE